MLDISALLAVPPHFADKGMRVWITDPPGAFDIVDTENATAEQVRFVIDIIERELPKHPLRSKNGGGYWFVHDYRAARRYESGARSQWTEFSKTVKGDTGRVDVVINPDATLLNMGAAVVSTLLSHLNVPMYIRGRFEDLPDGVLKPAAHLQHQRR
jgi:hypothetical protein